MLSRNGSLQRRLTLIFIVIVSLPLATAGYVVQHFVSGEIARRAVQGLSPALDANVQRYNDRVHALPQLVEAAVGRPKLGALIRKDKARPIEAFLRTSLGAARELDFLVVLGGKRRILGAAQDPPSFIGGFDVPSLRTLATNRTGPGFVATHIPVRVLGRGRVGSVAGGFWLDDGFLISSLTGAVNMSVASAGRVISSTKLLDDPVTIDIETTGKPFTTDIGGRAKAEARTLPGSSMSLVASTPMAPLNTVSERVLTSLVALLAIALLGTAAFAHLLARFITRPLDELSDGARAIAEGRFDHRIPVRSRDEIGQLAAAFNDMTERLSETITELQSSRDQLRRAVRRVGETLRSTHDMRQMLDSILNTAADAVEADAAALWTFTPDREELTPFIARGLGQGAIGRVAMGAGIVGDVALRGETVLVPSRRSGAPDSAEPAAGEPRFPGQIAIPLYSQDRVMGVLAVYRKTSARQFSTQDVETVAFLAEQGGVAIENVLLHEEAQRLSLTDGLTGLWNRRYFEMQFRQTLATAVRFQRNFSILMLDLDHFKAVNDNYGHQTGDVALIEVARRVEAVIREVDTFARYGGEEFICLLSETPLEGALTTAEKIRIAVRSEPLTVGSHRFDMTVSIGVASYPDHGESYTHLVDAADRGLYRAKQEGRDRVGEPGPPSTDRLRPAN